MHRYGKLVRGWKPADPAVIEAAGSPAHRNRSWPTTHRKICIAPSTATAAPRPGCSDSPPLWPSPP